MAKLVATTIPTAKSDYLVFTTAVNIDALGGDDIIIAGSGNDILAGGAGNDSITAGGGNDTLSGGAGTDLLFGGVGNDTLTGGAGLDVLTGGSGNDVYTLSATDNLDLIIELAGGGVDTINTAMASYSLALLPNVENLAFTGAAGVNFTGSGNALANLITGGDGNDTLSGRDGDDTLSGGKGDDILNGGSGRDTVSYAYLTDAGSHVTFALDEGKVLVTSILAVGPGNPVGVVELDTLAEFENFIGGGGSDVFIIGAGGQSLAGGGGTDTFLFSAGGFAALTIADFAHGSEKLDFSQLDPAVFNAGNAVIAQLGDDVQINFAGGAGGSVILKAVTGISAASDMLFGATSHTIVGTSGNDDGIANPSLVGDFNDNTIEGLAGNDRLYGEGGDDLLNGGPGNDIIDGGEGNDTASYEGTEGSLNIDLSVTTAQNTLGSGNDTLVNIENLIGGSGNDTLKGKAGVNRIDGGPGDDIIIGDNANGNSPGGPNPFTASDVLVGGPGSDTFVFNSGFFDYVTIADFDLFVDKIDLRDFFANEPSPAVDYLFANEAGVTITVFRTVPEVGTDEVQITLAGVFRLDEPLSTFILTS